MAASVLASALSFLCFRGVGNMRGAIMGAVLILLPSSERPRKRNGVKEMEITMSESFVDTRSEAAQMVTEGFKVVD